MSEVGVALAHALHPRRLAAVTVGSVAGYPLGAVFGSGLAGSVLTGVAFHVLAAVGAHLRDRARRRIESQPGRLPQRTLVSEAIAGASVLVLAVGLALAIREAATLVQQTSRADGINTAFWTPAVVVLLTLYALPFIASVYVSARGLLLGVVATASFVVQLFIAAAAAAIYQNASGATSGGEKVIVFSIALLLLCCLNPMLGCVLGLLVPASPSERSTWSRARLAARSVVIAMILGWTAFYCVAGVRALTVWGDKHAVHLHTLLVVVGVCAGLVLGAITAVLGMTLSFLVPLFGVLLYVPAAGFDYATRLTPIAAPTPRRHRRTAYFVTPREGPSEPT